MMNTLVNMHDNEFNINKALVYDLILNQYPSLANLDIVKIVSNGTDHSLFRLGQDYLMRLPRINRRIDNIHKEYKWLYQLQPFVKTTISVPIFKGSPNNEYPYYWLITKWIGGLNPSFEIDSEYSELAVELALFLNQFHCIDLTNGPISRRGINLKKLDQETNQALDSLNQKIEVDRLRKLWNHLSSIPSWSKPSVWIHGDLLPGNVIVQNDKLKAIIDFSDVGIGDPASDLIIAWSLFNSKSRNIFKQNLIDIDNNTWQRGRDWALSIALIMLSYYHNRSIYMTLLAKRIISQVIEEE